MEKLPEVKCLNVTEVWMEMPLCEQITDVVKLYLNRTATAHDCPGFNCPLCSLDIGWRYATLNSEIFHLLKKKGILMMARATRIRCGFCGEHGYNPSDVAARYCGKCHRFLNDASVEW